MNKLLNSTGEEKILPIRKAKDLSAYDKNEARVEIARQIFLGGEDVEDRLQACRLQLADRLNVSLGSIGSITAYVRYKATEVLHQALNIRLTPDELVAAFYFLHENSLSIEAANMEVVKKFLEQHRQVNISDQELLSALLAYEAREPFHTIKNDGVAISIVEDESSESQSNDAEPDYDNETKRKWRARCFEYCDAKLPKNMRAKAKAFCFCATEWYEVEQIFDKLGIKRENVWGAEMNPKLQERAAARANDLGTKFFPGDASILFEQDGINFDLVILDFKGSPNTDLIYKIPYVANALLILNTLRRRENRDLQRRLQLQSAMNKNKSGFEAEKGMSLGEMLSKYVLSASEYTDDNPEPVKDVIEDGYDSLVLSFAGSANKKKWPFRKKMDALIERYAHIIPESRRDKANVALRFNAFLVTDSMNIIDAMKAAWSPFMQDAEADEALQAFLYLIQKVTHDVLLNLPDYSQVEKYEYISESRGHCPYLTTMAALSVNTRINMQNRDIAEFMLNNLMELEDNGQLPASMEIVIEDRKRNRITRTPENFLDGGLRFVTYNNGQRKAVLAFNKIFEASKNDEI